jgi:DNA-binding SARP family transcriptional activator
MRVEIRLLGGFAVPVDGREVAAEGWRRRHAAAVVKLLALTPTRRLHREQVVDALWPELLVDEALPRSPKAAHFARQTLGVPDAVVLRNDAVALFPGSVIVDDVSQFIGAQVVAVCPALGGGARRQALERATNSDDSDARAAGLATLNSLGAAAVIEIVESVDEA